MLVSSSLTLADCYWQVYLLCLILCFVWTTPPLHFTFSMGTEIVGRCPPHVHRIKQEVCVSEVKKTYTTRGDSYSTPEDDEYIPPHTPGLFQCSVVLPLCVDGAR